MAIIAFSYFKAAKITFVKLLEGMLVCFYFNPNQDEVRDFFFLGGGGGWTFSNVTSTNVGISPKNFLTFILNPFATLM